MSLSLKTVSSASSMTSDDIRHFSALSASSAVKSQAMPRQVYISGKLVPKELATVSVFDHGLLYGDGVFEGLRSYGSKVFRLAEHIERLYDSAQAIRLEIPLSRDEMAAAINDTVAA